MKTSLLFAYLLGGAIVCLSSSQEGSTAVSYHGGIRSKKIFQQESVHQSSDRLLREEIARRTSSLGETVNHIWAAAVEETADTISSTYDKCRLADGTVVINGEPYYGKGKSKSKGGKSSSCRSSKGSKGSDCAPTPQPSEYPTMSPGASGAELPSASPTECYGKGKSCKLGKKKSKSEKSHKSKLSKSSKHSKSPKSGKGKYDNANLPYCDEMAPTVSPTRNENANTLPPTDPIGQNDLTSTPTFAPTTAEEFARCDDIRNGTGNTTGDPDQIFKLYVLVESDEILEDDFAERLNTAMRTILALASGCRNTDFSAMTSRRLQANTPGAVELEGFELLDLAGLTCEQVFGVEVSAAVCTAFESLVQAFGGEITADIEQICEDYGPQLATALGVETIHCVVDKLPFDILVPTSSPTTAAPTGPTASPTAPTTPTTSPSAAPTDDPGINGITDRDGQTIETGGWIIMAAGILVLFSLCLCYFCNRRAEKERGMAVYAKTYDDGESSMGDNADEGATSRAIFVNPEQDNFESDKYAPTDVAPTDEEEEYPVKRSSTQTGDDYFDAEQASTSSPVDDIILHDKGQVCSSPTCRLCEDRRREGPVALSVPRLSNQNNQYPNRGYIQDDTVEL
uniref:Uncharacterized protein n=1 Tax=Amphora coffeiformis TaxID=265554 RepID=A0A7S3KZ12_9STRA